MKSPYMLGMTVALAAGLSQITLSAVRADNQPPAALAGQVTSDAEGAMEGVVVSAKNPARPSWSASPPTRKGRYSFPENRLGAGPATRSPSAPSATISRAPTAADVAGEKTANVDLKLNKTKNLASQLTNAEWMMSIPGTEEQKAQLLNCTSCHTLERIVRSTHDADEWTQVITRMMGYGAVSQPIKPQRMLDTSRAGKPEQYRKFAEYLATINLSTTDHWEYQLKTLPRPNGRATRAIVTEYDVPRPTTEPHDVLVDKDGNVWYSDFGEMFISKFDPKTLKLTEYPIKKFKPNAPVGLLSIEFDKTGKLWFDTMYQGSLGRSIRRPARSPTIRCRPQWNDDRVQLNFVGLHHEVDGKVWTKSVGTQDIFRVDLDDRQVGANSTRPTKLPACRHAGIYQVISDSKNNLWMAEFTEGHLGKIDAKTAQSDLVRHADGARPRPPHGDRRSGPHPGDRISRQQGRAVRHQDGKVHRIQPADPYTYPYRADLRQER